MYCVVAKQLDFLLDFCIEKDREKNLVVWPRLKLLFPCFLHFHGTFKHLPLMLSK